MSVSKQYNYRLYGMFVRSSWPLPCPEGREDGLPVIDLLEGTSPLVHPDDFEDPPNQCVTLKNGSVYLRWPGPVEFLIAADGRRILAHLSGPHSNETFQAVLFGGVFSIALLKLGIEQLHATAIVDGESVAGFMGETGQGKSSLAAAFVQRGCPLLTDDLLVIYRGENAFMARPGLPRLKLFQDTAAALGGTSLGNEAAINRFTGKQVIRLFDHHFYTADAPIRALYTLDPRPAESVAVTLESVSQRDAFVEICRAAFNSSITGMDRLREQFVLASRLAAAVPVKRLVFPKNFEALPRVCDTILADLKCASRVDSSDMLDVE